MFQYDIISLALIVSHSIMATAANMTMYNTTSSAQDLELISALISMRTGFGRERPISIPSPVVPTVRRLKPAPVYSENPIPTDVDGKIGPATLRYSPQERREALKRYKMKKLRRNTRPAIRYQIRKRLADTRPRCRGRFFKLETEEIRCRE